ncbi:hypothetical protein [Streptomyces indicus]|uniref:Uncharacterized protein n=1 Tax=Streptomyces indicus TaxID=417292 RepID=A0A1G9D878_9ACTN|nr:hypothetical protein [Streptomyces indicus]SDK60126.1 hypothetical protein SAMN05421806_10977 [Streptomyces indicus]
MPPPMARHRKSAPGPTRQARRRLAASLAGVSALAATLLTLSVDPAAPPAPDRLPTAPDRPQAAP